MSLLDSDVEGVLRSERRGTRSDALQRKARLARILPVLVRRVRLLPAEDSDRLDAEPGGFPTVGVRRDDTSNLPPTRRPARLARILRVDSRDRAMCGEADDGQDCGGDG